MSDSEGTELLYETPESGLLQINSQGKAYRDSGAPDYSGPSLSGVQPAYGRSATQKGLGGSLVSASTDDPAQDPHDVHAPVRAVMAEPRKEVPLTPEQMMAMANQMENEMYAEHKARMAQGPAVDPNQDLPDFIKEYVHAQPEYVGGPSGVTVVDKVGGHKYLSEHERLRKLRDEHRAAGLK